MKTPKSTKSTKWNDVFSPRSKIGDYYVKPPWQSVVLKICQGAAYESYNYSFHTLLLGKF